MPTVNDVIVSSAQMTTNMIEPLASGIDPSQFGRLPMRDGTPVQTNHPAWVYGHLALYPERVLGLLGMDVSAVTAPQPWHEVFENGTECRDDPNASIYPAKEDLVSGLKSRMEAAIEAAASAGQDALNAETPERYRSRFPTIGDAANFLLGGHAMFHLGQVSAWRRMMGMPSAM